MAEIEINGVHYLTQKLGVIDSWHVARKLIPYLVATGPLARMGDQTSGDLNPQSLDYALKSIAEAIAGMSYADWNFVINICLGAVRRRDPQTGNLRPVIQLNGPPEQKGQLLYETEMNWSIIIKLTMEVANADVTPFLGDLLPSLMGLPTNGATGEPMAISGSPTA